MFWLLTWNRKIFDRTSTQASIQVEQWYAINWNPQSTPVPKAPSTLGRCFPIAVWLPKYERGKFQTAELTAAVSSAVLLIPKSMG